MISFRHKGSFRGTEEFFERTKDGKYLSGLDRCGIEGVKALALATPVDTGLTASSWDYEIHKEKGKTSIIWTNSNVNDGVNVAIILQYGHATKNGGYVVGIDYINPAMKPVFDKIAKDAWEEVKRK